jgi:hypothetical protein
MQAQVYPVSGTQQMRAMFDWPHTDAGAAMAMVQMSTSATTFSAFGLTGTGPALPYNEWSEVRLRVGEV